jgi:hypothetical protein
VLRSKHLRFTLIEPSPAVQPILDRVRDQSVGDTWALHFHRETCNRTRRAVVLAERVQPQHIGLIESLHPNFDDAPNATGVLKEVAAEIPVNSRDFAKEGASVSSLRSGSNRQSSISTRDSLLSEASFRLRVGGYKSTLTISDYDKPTLVRILTDRRSEIAENKQAQDSIWPPESVGLS